LYETYIIIRSPCPGLWLWTFAVVTHYLASFSGCPASTDIEGLKRWPRLALEGPLGTMRISLSMRMLTVGGSVGNGWTL